MNTTHAELESDLARARVGVAASDLHGSIAGYLCGGGMADAGQLLDVLELDIAEGSARKQVDAYVEELCRGCRADLDDAQPGFEPLLPVTNRPLPERAAALVAWCSGFLGGFGLASAQRKQRLSTDGSEVLRDFSTIAGSDLVFGKSEDDEHSLMELSEFVRVGALLLHAEVAAPRVSDGDAKNNEP